MSTKEISVTFMSGPLDGRTLRFEQPDTGDELVLHIGRREGCDVHMPFDNQVSRLHARLGVRSMPVTASDSVVEPFVLSFWLEDLDSRNGTFIERERTPIKERISVRPGSLFRIGRTWMRLDEPMSL
ncbi:MAG: FHA domain-containing protein [bacterium]|nr:FHA domain-containing protein [bacterium]